ncbi:MAG: hypothetical protein QXG05_08615 [Nitrososphaerota archaeon]
MPKNKQNILIILANCNLERDKNNINNIVATISYSDLGQYYTNGLEGRELFEGKYIRTEDTANQEYKSKDYLSVNNPQEIDIKKFLKDLNGNLALGMIRYSAGGAIPVLQIQEKKYVLMIRKQKEASVHGEHLTTASGLSETWEELLNPNLLIGREFLEEVIIFDRNLKNHFNVKLSFDTTMQLSKDKFEEYLRNHKYLGNYSNMQQAEYPYPEKYKKLKELICNRADDDIEEVEIEGNVEALGEDEIILKKELKDEIKKNINNQNNKSSKNIGNNNEDDSDEKIVGKVVIDSAYGAIDLIGMIKISFDKYKSIKSPEDLRILDFDTDEDTGKFLHREIFLVDLDNLKKLIEAKPFDCSIYSVSVNDDKLAANYSKILAHYKCPALSPPLRGTLDSCYNKLKDNSSSNIEFKYDASQQYLVDSVTLMQEIDSEVVSFGQIYQYHYAPVLAYKIATWNSNTKWYQQILMMLSNEPKEVKQIVDKFARILEGMSFEYFSSLPYYTEHFSTHIRNVVWFSYQIMQIDRTNFTELDVLLITLAAMIHDLGQYDPIIHQGSDIARKDPRYLIDVYLTILDHWQKSEDSSPYKYIFTNGNIKDLENKVKLFNDKSKNDIKELNETIKEPNEEIKELNKKITQVFKDEHLTEFSKLVLAIAMYHPKDMVFDGKYRNRRKNSTSNKTFVKNIISLDEVLRLFVKSKQGTDQKLKIRHYIFLASILQLADAIDAWKYRDVSFEVYVQKLRGVMFTKSDAKMKEDALDAWIKDLLIEEVKIEDNNSKYNIIFELDKNIGDAVNAWIKDLLIEEVKIEDNNSKYNIIFKLDKNIGDDLNGTPESDVYRFEQRIKEIFEQRIKEILDEGSVTVDDKTKDWLIKKLDPKSWDLSSYHKGLLKKEILENIGTELELVKPYLNLNGLNIESIKLVDKDNNEISGLK